MSALTLFVPSPRGLEPVLADELTALGATAVNAIDGGVQCRGDVQLVLRVNLESRVASRVLVQVAHGTYDDEKTVYQLARTVDWPKQFAVTQRIKVKTDGVGAKVRSLDFISLTVKDAICDVFRDACGERPSVDTRFPDVRIHVFLSPTHASLYLDTSGEPLFKRGWRGETGDAPLRENLAAGILRLAGYDGTQPLLDPMCGSGTFLVEAADIALNRAPGRLRKFAFEQLAWFDATQWQQVRDAAQQAERPLTELPIVGNDESSLMIELAQRNLTRAGLDKVVQTQVGDAFDTRAHAESGLIVSNPPYGVRMDELDTLAAMYPLLGSWLKQYFAGWTANLLSGDMRLPKLMRLTPKRRIPLYNGALECRLFQIPMVAGSNRREKV